MGSIRVPSVCMRASRCACRSVEHDSTGPSAAFSPPLTAPSPAAVAASAWPPRAWFVSPARDRAATSMAAAAGAASTSACACSEQLAEDGWGATGDGERTPVAPWAAEGTRNARPHGASGGGSARMAGRVKTLSGRRRAASVAVVLAAALALVVLAGSVVGRGGT
eukprot:432982-Prymnesium_polylepis.1